MARFELEGPDGARYEVEAPDAQSAVAAFKKMTAAQAPAPEESTFANDAAFIGQQANRGLADIAGAPVDLMAGGLNLGLMGADALAGIFGGSVDTRIEKPMFGSDWIADMASSGYEALGGNVVDRDSVSGGARIAGAGARGAGAAVIPAMGLASAPMQASGRLASLTKPYAVSPGATIARDAAAGAGAGLSAEAYDELAPESVQDSFASPLLKAGASIAGGLTGAAGVNVVEGLARGGVNLGRNAIFGAGDPNAPVNQATGKPFSRTEMDTAARIAQQMPTNRAQTIANIDDGVRDFSQFANPNQMPTVGMMADDVGMAMQENIMRTRDAQRFAERDAARRGLASSKVQQSAPAGADGRVFTETATRQYDDALAGAQRNVDDVVARQTAAADDIARQNVELEDYRANQPQASAAMARDFEAARADARSAKNAAYDAVDPTTKVDGRYLDEAVREIKRKMPKAEAMNPGPYSEIARRIERLTTDRLSPDEAASALGDIDPTRLRRHADGSVTIVKDITWGDLKALRAQVSEARKAAVGQSGQSVAGSGADVQRLDELSRVLGHLADEINPDAARFYREQYAPRFKEGRAGEYGAARDRAARTGGESSATRPSEFGDKFLRNPEDAASLRRAMTPLDEAQQNALPGPGASGTPRPRDVDPNTARNARDWMMGDLAKSGVLTDNAEIRFDRFRAWADKNRATIDQFPDLARTVDDELARAQRGGALSRQLANEVRAARDAQNLTKRELDRSALRAAVNASPEKAVGRIMNSSDPEKQMADMVNRLSGDRQATDGLKAAVRDWIKDETGLTSKIVGDPDATRVSRASMEKLFQRHEKTLARIYSPDEMNVLRQAHKLMGAEAKLDVRTTAGSNTADKSFAQTKAAVTQRKRVLEAGLKAKFGVLKGGGIFRTMNLFLESLPDSRGGLEDILFEMQFNPELAKHLLARPVKEIGSPGWNSRLNQLLGVATGAREAVEETD
jgi:hypothetical protein